MLIGNIAHMPPYRLDLLTDKNAMFVFGVPDHSIRAETFNVALRSLVDATYAANNVAYGRNSVTIRVVTLENGSVAVVLRALRRPSQGFLKRAGENILFGIVATALYALATNQETSVEIVDGLAVVDTPEGRIIITEEALTHSRAVAADERFRKSAARAFAAMKRDQEIEYFGISDTEIFPEIPAKFPREIFANIVNPNAQTQDTVPPRPRTVPARIVLTKPWLKKGTQKWSFEWNGQPISVAVSDEEFLQAVHSAAVRFGTGDALDVDISFIERWNESIQLYVTDQKTYDIEHVYQIVPQQGEPFLIGE